MQIFVKTSLAIMVSIISVEVLKQSIPVGVFLILCFIVVYGLFCEEEGNNLEKPR